LKREEFDQRIEYIYEGLVRDAQHQRGPSRGRIDAARILLENRPEEHPQHSFALGILASIAESNQPDHLEYRVEALRLLLKNVPSA
jgi:hypothetical protein